jgi:alpha-L-fucosidase 2
MKTTRRKFLQAGAAATTAGFPPLSAANASSKPELDGFEIAQRHRLVHTEPTPNFFEGMLLGNGDVGVCVTVRPDALGLHLGKSDSWDIRVSEEHWKYVLPFDELRKLWQRAGEEAKRQGNADMLFLETNIDFFREYTDKVTASYRKPWPRPWPCGIVWIHWDPRWVRVRKQSLDPSNGLFTLELDCSEPSRNRRRLVVQAFVDWETGDVCVATDSPAPFTSVTYFPYDDPEAGLPRSEIIATGQNGAGVLKLRRRFPALAPTDAVSNPPQSSKDRHFALAALLSGAWTFPSTPHREGSMGNGTPHATFLPARKQPFRLDLVMLTSRDASDPPAQSASEAGRLASLPATQLRRQSETHWRDFWSRSAVECEDEELERIWYHNQYFLACCLREGKLAPGLFGNWTSGNIGTAWHGDYHMNYNTQQVFWGVFSSNHAEQHFPYIELVESLQPMSENYAKEKFGLPGAFFPHSAYPVPSQVVPYPAPPWGYEVCETPWVVQSLWWHYLYTRDDAILKRVYPLLRAAARFLAAYVTKGDDGKYHIIPTVSPENWGFTVDDRLNKDCIMDLALSAFVLDAVIEASRLLGTDESERSRWAEVRANLAPYPQTGGPLGEVWADVANAPAEHVYNVPVTLAPVFPGEQVGLGRGDEHLEIARRTAETVRLEGGNDLVYQPLIRARLGMLDLDWFKGQVRYCLLPNGIANDRVRQIGGRYRDTTNFDFMMRMGVWTENLSLPAVLNECLLQSYTGTIRLFPNTHNLGRARFQHLRATGAFLVSASYDGTKISTVEIHSEKGATARVQNPWSKRRLRVTRARDGQIVKTLQAGSVLTFPTEAGETYRVEPV